MTPDELFLIYKDGSVTVNVYQDSCVRLVHTNKDGTKTEVQERLSFTIHSQNEQWFSFDKGGFLFEADKKKLLIQFDHKAQGHLSLWVGAERWAQLTYVSKSEYHTASIRIGDNTAALFPNDKCTVHI